MTGEERQPLVRRMVARSPRERGRTATPLELFFDLVFVVAIAQAGTSLHHALAAGHFADGVRHYAVVFFAIWWAWMNFTWFASAYDSDDVPYRLATFVQLAGALVLAAGVTRAFEHSDFRVTTAGYVIIRIALVGQWLRAAGADPERRPAALRFAVGVTLLQMGWVALLFAPPSLYGRLFALGVLLELLVPAWAEHAAHTTWHPHHIAERYGLLTIIVLGESILAATIGIQTALDAGEAGDLAPLIGSGLLLLFSMWWLYFERPVHDLLTGLRRGFIWGYGHYFVFASAGAVGVGLVVEVEQITGHAHIGAVAAAASVAVPAAVYLFSLWLLHHRPQGGRLHLLDPLVIALILASPWTGHGVLLTGLLLAGLLAFRLVACARIEASAAHAG